MTKLKLSKLGAPVLLPVRAAQVALVAALVALVALVASAPLAAQTLTGSISGVVRDDQAAILPGASVTLTGRQGTQNQVSDSEGRYRFAALEPGTYELSVQLQGFQTTKQSELIITAGRNLEIDLTMKVGGVAENVTVVGESPVVDVKSSATETTISQDLLYSAPITRTAINVLNYAPGINSSSAYGGDSGSANSLLIDGVDTRDPSGGTAWSFYNYNIIQEIQFQGLGAPAEYGGFTGAVVNTITKSGGNRFTGLFDVLMTNSGLGSKNVPADVAAKNPNLADPAKTTSFWDLTTQIGGPIKQNKLFYFASAQRFLLETDPSGPVTRRHEVSPRLNLKLTWQPSSNDNFTGHLQYDAYNIIGRAGVSALIATDKLTNREDAPEYLWLGQWRHVFGANTFSEVKYTGWWGFYDLNPEVKDSYHIDENGLITGGQGWFYYADRDRHQVNASVTHYADKFGRHDLKFGAEFERSKTRDRYGYSNGFTFYDYGGVPYYAYSYGYDVSANNTRTSVFAQDSWRIGNRVSVNLGLRGDLIRGDHPDLGNVYSSNNWAPRLGISWDLMGDNRTVAKGTYGQYYEGAQTTLFTRAVPGVQDFVTYFVVDGDIHDLEEVSRSVLSVPYKVASDIKHPRVDEVTLAFERALSAGTRLVVTGIWRDSENFVNAVNPVSRWSVVNPTNQLTNQPIQLYRWANRTAADVGSNFIIQNVDGFQYFDSSGNLIGTAHPFRKYRAVMFVLSKRLANRWQAQASYVYSKTTGNVDNNGGQQVATRQFTTPNYALINAEGHNTNDRPHEFKLLGTYQIPVVDVAVNGYFRILSGRTYTPFQQFTNAELNMASAYRRPYLEPLGSRRLDKAALLDLRLEKVFRIEANQIGLYFDIENVTNSSNITSVLTRVPGTDISTQTGTVTLPFETPGALVSPRQMRIGLRWSF
jgi:Carboxypeptidase regulatory-like domain